MTRYRGSAIYWLDRIGWRGLPHRSEQLSHLLARTLSELPEELARRVVKDFSFVDAADDETLALLRRGTPSSKSTVVVPPEIVANRSVWGLVKLVSRYVVKHTDEHLYERGSEEELEQRARYLVRLWRWMKGGQVHAPWPAGVLGVAKRGSLVYWLGMLGWPHPPLPYWSEELRSLLATTLSWLPQELAGRVVSDFAFVDREGQLARLMSAAMGGYAGGRKLVIVVSPDIVQDRDTSALTKLIARYVVKQTDSRLSAEGCVQELEERARYLVILWRWMMGFSRVRDW